MAFNLSAPNSQLYVVFMIAMAFLRFSTTTVEASENQLWHSPCSVGDQARQIQGFFQNINEPDSDAEIPRYERELIRELRNSVSNARRLNRFILRNRLLHNTHLVRDCETIPPLMGMPQVEVTHELVSQDFHSTLPYDFQRLARVAVFVNEMYKDSNGNYGNRFSSLLANVRKSMCLMEVVALSRGQTIVRDVTERVMPVAYKNLPDQAVRDMRNCLIVRDTSEIFDNINDWYSRWM